METAHRHGALRRISSVLAIGPFAIAAIAAIGALTVASCAKGAESRAVDTPRTETAAAETAAAEAQEQPGAQRAVAEPAAEGAAGEAKVAGDGAIGDSSYSLTLETPETVAPGSESVIRVVVTPKAGWKMNMDFPTKLTVSAPAGVKLTSKDKQSVPDAERFDDHGAAFAVKFQADTPGAHEIKANFKFAVCTDATCDPKKQELAWVVDVK